MVPRLSEKSCWLWKEFERVYLQNSKPFKSALQIFISERISQDSGSRLLHELCQYSRKSPITVKFHYSSDISM